MVHSPAAMAVSQCTHVPLPEAVPDDMRIRLSELLCTRLCHDITGPIGAVNNGVEFLREEGDELSEQAISLIDDSAKQAISRILYFRQCYGRVNFGGEANLEELRGLVIDFFAASKISCDWPPIYTDSLTYSFSRKMGKLMLNMILLASESLMRGGSINISMEKGEDFRHFCVSAEGSHVKCDDSITAILAGKFSSDALDPRSAQVFMTLLLASELGADITYSLSDSRFYMMAAKSND